MSSPWILRIFAAVASLAAAGSAQAYITSNQAGVEDRGDGSFYVDFSGQTAIEWFWCAAGEYAQAHLNAPPAAPIWRVSPLPRRPGEGVAFSLSGQNAQPSGLLRLGNRDDSVSVAAAQQLCDNEIRDYDD